MAYTINFSDSDKTVITLQDNTVDSSTDLSLVGKGKDNYGQYVAQNFLKLLENFADDSSPPRPIEGQLWYDSSNNNKLKYHDGSRWKEIANLTQSDTTPPEDDIGQIDGHMWLNSDTGNLWMYYDEEWRFIIDLGSRGRDNRLVFRNRRDTSEDEHLTAELIVDGKIVFIISSDEDSWNPLATDTTDHESEKLEDGMTLLNTEFEQISPGINIRGGDDSDFGFHGTATSARYKDLAERYHSDGDYLFGTVVELGGEYEITQTTSSRSTNVFGIISHQPALKMNSAAGNDITHPYVAFSGRLPVRVVGTIQKGDRLISSTIPGHAMSIIGEPKDIDWRIVIGRALESKDYEEAGIIEAVVGAK